MSTASTPTLSSSSSSARVLKPDESTKPNVFYIGLDARFEGRVDAAPTLWRPSNV